MRYSNSSTTNTGRFSAQLLSSMGIQRTIRTVQGAVANTFKYATGDGTMQGILPMRSMASTTATEPGYCSPSVYNQTRCFYLDRGASSAYADTMTIVSLDMGRLLGISTANLLEQSEVSGKMDFSDVAYYVMNSLRSRGDQVAAVSITNNRRSKQARQIRV